MLLATPMHPGVPTHASSHLKPVEWVSPVQGGGASEWDWGFALPRQDWHMALVALMSVWHWEGRLRFYGHPTLYHPNRMGLCDVEKASE